MTKPVTPQMTTATAVQAALAALSDPDVAAHSQRFFKTGPGQYGEGDVFRGIRVPVLRRIAKAGRALPLDEALGLLRSEFHEDRFVALCILVATYQRGKGDARDAIFRAYLDHTRWINSWDLVDASAHKIAGPHLAHGERAVLDRLADSSVLWERRIAIIATLHFIRMGEFGDTLRIAEALLDDPHDLIHKAVGWMLREVGKRDFEVQDAFMRMHYRSMPRTMLRYAIERYPEALRKAYLAGDVP